MKALSLSLSLSLSLKLSHAEMMACWVSRQPNLAAAHCLHPDALSPFSLYLRLSNLRFDGCFLSFGVCRITRVVRHLLRRAMLWLEFEALGTRAQEHLAYLHPIRHLLSNICA